jgi:hypothetical protein
VLLKGCPAAERTGCGYYRRQGSINENENRENREEEGLGVKIDDSSRDKVSIRLPVSVS